MHVERLVLFGVPSNGSVSKSTEGRRVDIARRYDVLTGMFGVDRHKRKQENPKPEPRGVRNIIGQARTDMATSFEKVANFGSQADSEMESHGFAPRPRDRFAVSVCALCRLQTAQLEKKYRQTSVYSRLGHDSEAVKLYCLFRRAVFSLGGMADKDAFAQPPV